MADELSELWRDLSRGFRKVAHALYADSEMFLLAAPDDIAQRGLMAVQRLLDRRKDEAGGQLVLSDELVAEVLRYGAKSMRNAFLTERKRARDHARKLDQLMLGSHESEGYHDLIRRRTETPEEAAIAFSAIRLISTLSKSERYQRIMCGLEIIVGEGGSNEMPVDVVKLTRTKTDDMAYVRRRIAQAGFDRSLRHVGGQNDCR